MRHGSRLPEGEVERWHFHSQAGSRESELEVGLDYKLSSNLTLSSKTCPPKSFITTQETVASIGNKMFKYMYLWEQVPMKLCHTHFILVNSSPFLFFHIMPLPGCIFVPSILPLYFHFTCNLLSIQCSISHSGIIGFLASICSLG